MSNQDLAERFIESRESINKQSKILSYFYDKDCKQKIPTIIEDKEKSEYKQILNPKTQKYEMQENKIKVKEDTGLIKLNYPDEKGTIQGESQSMIFYIRNNLKSPIELEPFTTDKHLTFTEYPKYLKSKEVGRIRLTFSPSFTRFEALDGGFNFNYIIHNKD